MKKLIALLLALIMLVGMVACGKKAPADAPQADAPQTDAPQADAPQADAPQTDAPAAKDLSWLHPNSEPMVDEGTEKTLRIYAQVRADTTPVEERFAYKYIEEILNINLEVTTFLDSNRDEFLSLAFAGGDLPDIIICASGSRFTTAELVRYGAQEDQLIDISKYLTEDIMPNLTRIYSEYPEYKTAVSTAEGAIYGLGTIGNVNLDSHINRTWYNYTWLEENNIAVPKTLDEFTEMLRAAKASGDYEYPLGGSYTSGNTMHFILNAFGYVFNANAGDGRVMAMRNGEPVLPVADREAYGEFLKYMNMLYSEGLIHPDFFTMDSTTADANASANQHLVVKTSPSAYFDAEGMYDWWGAAPLTSNWNSTPIMGINASAINVGGAVITSACQDVELACAFLDYFYDQSYDCLESHNYMMEYGPTKDQPLADMFTEDELRIFENGSMTRKGYGEYTNEWDWICNKAGIWIPDSIGTNMVPDFSKTGAGADIPALEAQYGTGPENRQNWPKARYDLISLRDVDLGTYTSEVFPYIVFLDAETQTRVSDLKVVIDDYAATETAKFIVGARSLDELDDYFDEIEKLGAAEYVQIYTDYYNALNG